MDFPIVLDGLDWLSRLCKDGNPKAITARSQAGTVAVVVHRHGCVVDFETPAGRRTSDMLAREDLRDLLASPDRQMPVLLRLAPDRYLKRPLSDRVLPYSRARAMALIDIEEALPFLRDDSCVLLPEDLRGGGTSYAVVRKSILDPIIAAIGEAGLAVSGIALDTEGEPEFVSKASLKSMYTLPRRVRLRRQLSRSVLGAAVILSVATFAHAYLRNVSAISRLAEITDTKQTQALAVRKKLERQQLEQKLLQAARAGKAESTPVTMIWEELTRILPDSTWLTDMSIRNGQVTITGFSNSAADLIAILGASPLLSNPSFASQVLRAPGQEGERFSIQMRIAMR
ncbi:PilN domain-containing protein [Agrobacterium rhizogenes]|uniref:PilN domain-containing protein n=1 Tax=Rhizobium rhizogenes TaxID=359 RepID=UPI0008100280|nr:PilN domain-containing protein [Rhizobium rhizogenes]OCJ23198.1 pilus assembly protein PilN [Agrobacterium sp. B133/95]NTG76220.1 PilN domain-containing protein [Rhizobium rhizogenes]NTH14833.1 PilN domain-containing protein [Rhizobium rhizogenes]NTI51132.1 PilN domain-containing protein [Rhizobium rhizogenes]NTI96504.1 PilN domain-containing protein [Rhizobium rhizogenes]